MKNKILLLIVLGGLLFTSCNCGKNGVEIEAGKRYLYSFGFDNPDPFAIGIVDTILVLDVEGEYMKFIDISYLPDTNRYSNHGRIGFYIDFIREIPTTAEESGSEVVLDEVSEEQSPSDISEW